MKSTSESSKRDRKTIERNRRIHMKGLCSKLASLIPSHHFTTSKDMLSQQDLLDHAASYIKQLTEKIEELKVKKEGLRLPVVELREFGCSLEVILISGLKKNFMLYQTIRILQEAGAEVVSASYSTVGDKVFHSLHAQVRISRVGVDTSRVRQRLQELIDGIC